MSTHTVRTDSLFLILNGIGITDEISPSIHLSIVSVGSIFLIIRNTNSNVLQTG